MYELKNGKVFTSKVVGTGPSSYGKRIYRIEVSQRLRNTALYYPPRFPKEHLFLDVSQVLCVSSSGETKKWVKIRKESCCNTDRRTPAYSE